MKRFEHRRRIGGVSVREGERGGWREREREIDEWKEEIGYNTRNADGNDNIQWLALS